MKQFNNCTFVNRLIGYSVNRFPFVLLLAVGCCLLVAGAAHAQLTNPLPTSAAADGVVDLYAFETIFANILAIAASFAGLAAFIMLIVGGFKWLTSGGDPKKLESAKSAITYAIIGLFGLVLIWLILKFIQMFTGSTTDITIFTLPRFK